MKVHYKLKMFEGPLDLLLHLIESRVAAMTRNSLAASNSNSLIVATYSIY